MRRRTSAAMDMLYLTLFLALLPFTAQGLAVPVISLNSTRVQDPVLTLTSGTSFSLSCEGHEAVFWKTRHSQHKKHVSKNTITVRHATPDDTGTYRCSYRNHSQLYSETHIYVTDPGRPFTIPQSTVVVEREGSDCLLDCLPTDPKATVFSLRLANRSAVHPEMKYTANPKEGIWIRDLRPYYSGDYVCTVNLNLHQRVSAVFQITVIKRVKHPPSVFTEVEELVRIVGEKLQVICYIANPDHSYHITWEDSSKKKLHAEHKVNRSSNSVLITSVLTLPEVRLSDSGNLSCIGNNSAGENRSVVSLRVVDKAYVQLSPLQSSRDPQQSVRVELHKGDLLELRVLVDAHPPVQHSWWDTPRPQNGSTYKQTLHRIHKSSRYIATMSLNRIRADENGWYTFNVRSRSVNSSIHFEVHVFQKPSVVVEWKNSTFTCVASGYPQPRVQWWQCGDLHVTGDRCNTNSSHLVELLSRQYMVKPLETFKPQQVESILDRNVIPRNTTIQCVAVNSVGEAHHAVFTGGSITLPEYWFSRIYKAVFTGSTVIVTVLILLLGVCIYKWKQKPRYEVRWKIIEVNDGNNYTYIDPTQLPYNTKWEFPRDRLTLGQVLGAGAFGKVVEATALGLNNDEGVTRVAVKMLKSSAHSEEREALMSELKILNHLGSHTNIVNLFGACTQGGPVLLITEYCCHGDLLSFLRRRAPLFLSSVVLDQGCSQLYKNLPVQEREKGVSNYEDMQSAHRLMNGAQGSCNGDEMSLDMDCLLRFAGQVAQGMDFLASKKCIHRDLAARNVLVTDCFVAKICDFGLARDIKNDSNYVVRGNARLPVKWMSPESIFECIYTVQSDVWSYGILLWEIFSLGGSPYPDVVVDARFYEMIKVGYHMPQPDFAPTEMYSIMKQCWNLQPTLRPPFSKVLRLISNLLPELQNSIVDQQYKNLHQELQQKIMSKQCTSAQEPEETEESEQPSNRAPYREGQRLLQQQQYHQPC